jgi:hypothetical protein
VSDVTHGTSDLLKAIAAALKWVDESGMPYKSSKAPFREYGLGVGPYSETQLCKLIAEHFNAHPSLGLEGACTKRFPDLLIPSRWAIELKIARPFGDNGKEAEHWSQNLLHPYEGNTSSLSDAMKLSRYEGPEVPVVVVVGYEHAIPKVDLEPLVTSFELIAERVVRVPLGARASEELRDLVHDHHQVAKIWAWEVRRGVSVC